MEAVSPLVDRLVRFVDFLIGLETVEKLLDSEQTETGESCNAGDRASSWKEKTFLCCMIKLITAVT